MTVFDFFRLRNYAIAGQDIEQSIRYEMTGEVCKADNIPFTVSGDCLGYQVKSARATICKGTDIAEHLKHDAATAYIYGTLEGKGYIMSRSEYLEFTTTFATVTRDSQKNGGAVKTRLKSESKALLRWLEERAEG